MAKVQIVKYLFEEIEKKFKGEAHKIIDLLESLEESPHKGKIVGQVGGIVVKEIKYNSFRFYFLVDGFKIKVMNVAQLTDLLIKFVRMSDKDNQQKVIDEIKVILRKVGEEGF
ncbi:MAG: hypothetical protein AABW80_01595 [Nanoarchaeota archaeon]